MSGPERELPPLRVRLIGDDSSFKKMIENAAKGVDGLGKALGKARVSEFEREFHNYRLLQKSKDIGVRNAINNILLLRKANDAAFSREWSNFLLLEKSKEKAAKAAEAKRTKMLKWNSKLLEDMQRGDEAAKAAAREKYIKHLKYNSKILEDQQKKEQQAAKDRWKGAVQSTNYEAKKAKQIASQKTRDAMDRWKGTVQHINYEEKKAKDRWKGTVQHINYEARKAREAVAQKTRDAKDRWQGLQQYHAYEAKKTREAVAARRKEQQQRTKMLKWNSKLLEDMQKGEEAARKAARDRYIKHLKHNSKILEDQQKAAEAKRNKDLRWNSKILEDQQKAAQAAADKAARAAEAKRNKDLRWNSKLLEDMQKGDEAAKKAAREKYIKNLKYNSKLLEDQQKGDEAAKKAAKDKYIKMLKYNSKIMEDQRKDAERAAKEAARAKERADRDAERRRQARERARLARVNAAKNHQFFRRPDAGFGMGARADIYMHANALQNLFSSGGGLLDMAAQLRDAEVMINTFTKDAGKTASILGEIKDFAAATPFTRLGLSDAARNMMSYGVAADQVVPMLKQIGEVAGGNEKRFDLMAYAMSQITSQGRLMGQELKQLTEHGFNPLAEISKATGISYDVLRSKMEAGQVSAKNVQDALRMATSQGGTHAGKLNALSKELGGLINQVREGVKNMALDLFRVIEGDLKKALMATLNYLEKIQAFLDTPEGKKAMVYWANVAKNVFLAVSAFHVLGFTLAVLRWQSANVMTLFAAFRLTIIPLTAAVSGLRFAVMLLGAAYDLVMLTITGSTAAAAGAFVTLGAGIAAGLAGIVALSYGVSAVRERIAGAGGVRAAVDGMVKDMHTWTNNIIGFFANINHNAGITADWLAKAFSEAFGTTAENLLKDMDESLKYFRENIIVGFVNGWLVFDIAVNTTMGTLRVFMVALLKGLQFVNKYGNPATGMWSSNAFRPGEDSVGTILAAIEKDTATREQQNRQNIANSLDALINGDAVAAGEGALASVLDKIRNLKGPQGLKLDVPKLDTSPPPDIPIPEAFNPDFSNLTGATPGKGGGAPKIQNALVAGTSQHAVQAYEHMRNLSAVQASGKASAQDLQKQQLNVQIQIRNGINALNGKMGLQANGAGAAQLDPNAKGF